MKHHNIFTYISLVQWVWTQIIVLKMLCLLAVGSHNTWRNYICVTILCFLDLWVQISLSYYDACVDTKVSRIPHVSILWTHFKLRTDGHAAADLKELCALEDEDMRLQLTSNSSKHSPWEGMRHSHTYATPTHS